MFFCCVLSLSIPVSYESIPNVRCLCSKSGNPTVAKTPSGGCNSLLELFQSMYVFIVSGHSTHLQVSVRRRLRMWPEDLIR
jgi:hypothetical protein